MGRQQLKEKTTSAEEEERAALQESISTGSGPHMLENQETNVRLKDDKLPVTTPSVITDAFKMDSDTDLDGEEEGVASAVPVTLTTNQKVDHTSDKAQFYMDSDTDVEDDNNASRTVPESAAPPENTKPLLATAVFQPEDITMDSDTDVDDDDTLDAASKAKSMSVQSKTTADSAPTTYLNLDSDTESEEEDLKRVQINSSFKINETPTELAEGISAPPPHQDSETYDEAVPAPAISKSGDAESCPAADTHADLDILSDSDTDVEDDSPLVKQTFVGTNMSLTHSTVSKAIQSDSDADTDVEESSTASILGRVTTASLDEEGEKDVEHEVALAAPGEGPVPHLVRENTPGLLNPSHQYCSTPVQLPGKY